MGDNGMAATPVDAETLRDEARCASSLVVFRQRHLAVSTDVAPAPFHHRWSDVLLRGRGHYACEGFRESGKDQIVFQANLLHALTYPMPTRRYIVIVAATQTLAAAKLRDVTRQFQARDRASLRLDLARVVEDSGQAFQAEYVDGMQVRIEAFGKGASIRGLVWGALRPDVMILNDIQDKSDADSPTTLEKDWGWFLSDCVFLGQSTRIFLIGNNLGQGCVIERVFDAARELGFVAERFPALSADRTAALWPDRFPLDMMLAERAGYVAMGQVDIWERERMCVAMAAESRPLRADDVQYYDDSRLDLSGAAIVTVVDPAISKKAGADPSVIATVAIMPSGTWDVLDVDRRQRDPTELVDDIFRAVARWRPQSVGVETVAYQEALAHLLEREQVRRELFFSIVRIRTSVRKELKIRSRLGPLLRTGALRIPRHSAWGAAFLSELAEFPYGLHDDVLDSLAMVEDARTARLIPSFDQSVCVTPEIPIPANWPIWASLVADPAGESVILMLTCTPDGRLLVIGQIFARTDPATLYMRFRDLSSGRRVISMAAPEPMWKEHPLRGDVWATVYTSAGFLLRPGPADWGNQLAGLDRRFAVAAGRPQLQIFPSCKRLLWELYNAAAGEQNEPDRKSIQGLLLLLSMGPRWRDMDADPVRSIGRNLVYPAADIP